ncbi:streptomycin 6-kinase [Salirhabdus euzebyi]|uniref:Streptomycin 6-kinase n=1 Tax=Salirhabdus euzebyi TaxID=394506 RepID=A0A841PYF3_9BACI|nr:aminoglycoside phosphotransferase family protein [Salirhabdus euzebyi]MBB6452686.1 streptomycin 6-kinase [Salirhabdus euzebyi]
MKDQQHFLKTVRHYFKEEGEKWLQQLPELIRYCETKWSLKMHAPYKLSTNYVAPATMSSGDEIVVKLCIPSDGVRDEILALQTFDGKGIVRLLDCDIQKGIILLEKVTPGRMLAHITDADEACRIGADVVRELTRPAPKRFQIASTIGREEKLRVIVNENPHGLGPIKAKILQKALHMFTYLNETIDKWFLLHGDFHPYNILLDENGQWKAIDPKGLMGELEYDLIQFILNILPDEGVEKVIQQRIDIFTTELNINKQRLLLWGYCHTVLATAWTVNEDGTFDEKFFQCIAIFEKLCSKYLEELEEIR